MIRGDNIICGTTTTGTGTLTLAATPVPPGGVDFDVFCRATGIGFGNSAAIIVSYTVIEYTDSTFATAKQHEKGLGTLTLGSSSGIANATLARTTLQTSATSLNSQPATQNITPATGISVGTAANTLVFIGASATDLMAFPPGHETSIQNSGVNPLGTHGQPPQTNCNFIATSGTDYYCLFYWPIPMLVKRLMTRVQAAYTGGVSNLYARLYQVNSIGRPGKLLLDFGLIGTAGSSLSATAAIQSAVATNGFFMTPGPYFMDFLSIVSGGSGTPQLVGVLGYVLPSATGSDNSAQWNANIANLWVTSTGGNATAPDPANTSALAQTGSMGSDPAFSLVDS